MNHREEWGTRAGFIFAAVGSAIGLGNIWRFPAVAYDNGGGAFFLPYLFALLTAGIPLLILEFTMGHRYRGSAPLTFSRMSKGSEWIGWWQVAISFVIATYYSVIIAWALSYTKFAISQAWGEDTAGFLIKDYLQAGEVGEIGNLVPGVLVPLIIVWVVILGVLSAGVKKGIETANKIFIPLLVILFFVVVIRAITLDGAIEGLNQFFKPDWSTIFNGKVWVAAYGQIFFSLSIGFAIMVTYSSYLPKKSDITNNAFITGFANSSFELLAGIGVFSALGFMAMQQGVGLDEIVDGGVTLAFAVFPSIINELPAFQTAFGVLFFLSLALAGISSLLSIAETFISGIQDKFQLNRVPAVLLGGGLSAIVSIIYATNGGLFILDTVDYFINQFGVALAGLFEVIFVSWYLKQLKPLQSHANAVSDIRIGTWWRICLSVITPIVLGYMMFDNLRQNLLSEYEDYPRELIFNFGWSVAIGVMLLATLMTMKKWNKDQIEIPSTFDKKEAQ